MYRNKKVSIVIPTYNESQSIRGVIDDFFRTGLVDEVVVVDNNALHNTKEEVLKTKARLVEEKKQGYGYALMRGMEEARGDLIVMCEADGTFQAKDIEKLLAYSDEFEVVLGTRTSRATIWSGAFMPFPVRFANWLWAKFIEILFNGTVLTDVGCTYKLISRQTLEAIKPRFSESKGDGRFSPELMIWLIESGKSIIEVPVIFKQRIGDSMYTGSIYKAAILGFRMIPLILRYRFKKINNLKYYLSKYKTEVSIFFLTFAVNLLNINLNPIRFSNDDQFILYRYIRNLSLGFGFVYNYGEKILGSTTVTYTLLASFLSKIFSGLDVTLVVMGMNLVFISISAVLFFLLISLYVKKGYALIGTFVFILNMSKVISEGMETSIFIFFLFSFLIALLKEWKKTSAIFLTLLVLTRPDAVLIAFLAFIYWLQNYGYKEAFRLAILSIVVCLPWLIFATFYFGSFIPQSIIAKMHTRDIVIQSNFQALKVQLASLSRIYWGKIFDPENIKFQVIFNLLPFLMFVFLGIKNFITKNNWIIFTIPFIYFIFMAVSNPVMFPWYLSQMEPLWILISFFGIAYLLNKYKTHSIQNLLILIIILGPVYFYTSGILSDKVSSKEPLFKVGNYLKSRVKDGEVVAVNNIGIIGYTSEAYIYDLFGLVNPEAPFFYPVTDKCRDRSAQYLIPPELVLHKNPDWLVLSGENELSNCFKNSRWFANQYQMVDWGGAAIIYKKKK